MAGNLTVVARVAYCRLTWCVPSRNWQRTISARYSREGFVENLTVGVSCPCPAGREPALVQGEDLVGLGVKVT
jgi:hypothetical protein